MYIVPRLGLHLQLFEDSFSGVQGGKEEASAVRCDKFTLI